MKKKETISTLYWDVLELFGGEEIPQYVLGYGKSFVTFRVSAYEGAPDQKLKVTVKDVIKYYAFQVNRWSGIRTLAGFSTDWKHIDNIADEALEYFKQINPELLRREAKKVGLKPQF